jgi:hypothetical protein
MANYLRRYPSSTKSDSAPNDLCAPARVRRKGQISNWALVSPVIDAPTTEIVDEVSLTQHNRTVQMGPSVHAYSMAKRGRLLISIPAARVAYSSSKLCLMEATYCLSGPHVNRVPTPPYGRHGPDSAPPMLCAALGTGNKIARGPPPGVKKHRPDEESKFRQNLTGSPPPPLDVTLAA